MGLDAITDSRRTTCRRPPRCIDVEAGHAQARWVPRLLNSGQIRVAPRATLSRRWVQRTVRRVMWGNNGATRPTNPSEVRRTRQPPETADFWALR